MQKVKQKIIELTEERLSERQTDDYVEKMDILKPTINSLLLKYLPEELTIKQADIIAMCIFELIVNPKDFL